MVVRPRTLRRALWLASATILLLGAAASYRIASAPLGLPPASAAAPATRDAGQEPSIDEPRPSAFEPELKRDLRRALYDPPPPAPPPAPAPAPKPPLPVGLAGTIVEPGHCKAMLVTGDGHTELRGVGQRLGEVEVLSIEEKKVTVRFNGDVVELKVKPRKGQG